MTLYKSLGKANFFTYRIVPYRVILIGLFIFYPVDTNILFFFRCDSI